MSDAIDLVQYINPAQSFCLNESKEHNFRNCLVAEKRVDPKVFLQSDCDEASAHPTGLYSGSIMCDRPYLPMSSQELLIHIAFSQNVRLTGLQIQGPADKGAHVPCALAPALGKLRPRPPLPRAQDPRSSSTL